MSEPTDAETLPRALTMPLDSGRSRTLPLALLLAASLHLFLILTVSFKMPQPVRHAPADVALEVLIMRDTGQYTANPEPDAALSQRSRVGESPRGDGVIAPEDDPDRPAVARAEDEPQQPDVPEPPPPDIAPPPAQELPPAILTAAPPPKPERQVRQAPKRAPDPQPAPAKRVDAAQILTSRDQEIDRLTESLEARSAAYASRQRRKSISASTREFRYASYLGAWARKVEQIGNLNYPQAAKDQHLQGSLILDVALRADGSVEQIRVVQSSGYELLDQAAIKIVQLAAPYSPFPPEIAAETDVLDVVRTWQFLRGGTLGWQE